MEYRIKACKMSTSESCVVDQGIDTADPPAATCLVDQRHWHSQPACSNVEHDGHHVAAWGTFSMCWPRRRRSRDNWCGTRSWPRWPCSPRTRGQGLDAGLIADTGGGAMAAPIGLAACYTVLLRPSLAMDMPSIAGFLLAMVHCRSSLFLIPMVTLTATVL